MLFAGETMKAEFTVRDRDGDLFDPDSVVVTALSPSGDETVNDGADIINISTGVYRTYFPLSEAGIWHLNLTMGYTENSESITEIEEYQVAVDEPVV
jgi:hypothetical protein